MGGNGLASRGGFFLRSGGFGRCGRCRRLLSDARRGDSCQKKGCKDRREAGKRKAGKH